MYSLAIARPTASFTRTSLYSMLVDLPKHDSVTVDCGQFERRLVRYLPCGPVVIPVGRLVPVVQFNRAVTLFGLGHNSRTDVASCLAKLSSDDHHLHTFFV